MGPAVMRSPPRLTGDIDSEDTFHHNNMYQYFFTEIVLSFAEAFVAPFDFMFLFPVDG